MKNEELSRAVTETVRRWAKPTTVQDLQRRGVERVRRVDLARMSFLIETAVNRALLARTVNANDESEDSLSRATRSEFLSLLRDEEQKDGLEERAGSELGRLKRELSERRASVEADEQRVAAGVIDVRQRQADLETKLREVFTHFKAEGSDLERQVIAIALEEIKTQGIATERERIAAHRREMELLERRISKLSGLLGETEQELAKTKDKDSGIASGYRPEQGITDDDDRAEQKRKMMGRLFEENSNIRSREG